MGKRLHEIVKTILRQLARQAGGARVMQIGSKIKVANRESDTAGEVPSSPGRSPSLYDPCDEAFGASPEAGLQRHDEPRRDPSSWRESRVNGGNDESSDKDYISVPWEIGAS